LPGTGFGIVNPAARPLPTPVITPPSASDGSGRGGKRPGEEREEESSRFTLVMRGRFGEALLPFELRAEKEGELAALPFGELISVTVRPRR
jgi:hypothetical protein